MSILRSVPLNKGQNTNTIYAYGAFLSMLYKLVAALGIPLATSYYVQSFKIYISINITNLQHKENTRGSKSVQITSPRNDRKYGRLGRMDRQYRIREISGASRRTQPQSRTLTKHETLNINPNFLLSFLLLLYPKWKRTPSTR